MAVRDVIQAAAGSAGDSKTYIEDVFSTYLYTGNGSTQTINNGIDLAGKGGMVWTKHRSLGNHNLFDTNRGIYKGISTNATNAQYNVATTVTSFNSNGFSLGSFSDVNESSINFASWTFRKAPKFFDVVTYTGDGVAGRAISHSLGTTPGMIIVKCTSNVSNWAVWQRSLNSNTGNGNLYLESTNSFSVDNGQFWGNDATATYIAPTASSFYVAANSATNASGRTYVAYLFAHDTTTDGLIQCGSFTTDASGNATVNLGWEPQYILVKPSNAVGDWHIADVMRGASQTAFASLVPNSSAAENLSTGSPYLCPTATGFTTTGYWASTSLIYMAIRRGPMKTPTDGTKVFQPVAYTATNVDNRLVDTGIVTDMAMARTRTTTSTGGFFIGDRFRGSYFLGTAATSAETTDLDSFMTPTAGYGAPFSSMNGFGVGNDVTRLLNYSTYPQMAYAFKRAPGFFDVVCYSPTGATAVTSYNHALGVAPELIIVKQRNGANNWIVYHKDQGTTKYLVLNSTAAVSTANMFGGADAPQNSSVFTVGDYSQVNWSGNNYVAYLFASCPGVSKVGTYTGTETTQTINCGFTGGARFVLIKQTNGVGAWYVWDTSRGMVSGTDPLLELNSTAAELNANTIYTTTGGFQIVTAGTAINGVGGTYIYLAIA